MKVSSPFRTGVAVIVLASTALTPCAFAIPFHAIRQAGGTGKVRPVQPQGAMEAPPPPANLIAAFPVQVTVSQSGKHLPGISVTFKTSAHSVAATTNKSGVASVNLMSGYYTVTASSGGKTATRKIHVVSSSGPITATLSIPAE